MLNDTESQTVSGWKERILDVENDTESQTVSGCGRSGFEC
jgi:hypothetical protein